MLLETLATAAFQSAVLFLVLWGAFRLMPSIPANARAWLWRMAFVKPLLCLMPFAVVAVPILPPLPASTGNAGPHGSGPVLSLVEATLIFWLLGAGTVAVCGFVGTLRLRAMLRFANPITEPEVQDMLHELSRKAGLQRAPRLLCSSEAKGAMLVAGRTSTIVLPEHAVFAGNRGDLRMMLAHEIAHIARHDLWWLSAIFVSNTAYFFNPMAWLAARWARADHESATDQQAALLAGVSLHQYADMLLRATVVARPPAAPGTAAMSDRYKNIQSRLEAMKNFNRKPTWQQRAVILALGAVTLSFLPSYQLSAQEQAKIELARIQRDDISLAKIQRENVQLAKVKRLQDIKMLPKIKLAKPAQLGTVHLARPVKLETKSKARVLPFKVSLKATPEKASIKDRSLETSASLDAPAKWDSAQNETVLSRVADRFNETKRGVPVLSNIPIIGRLFQVDRKVPVLSDIPIVEYKKKEPTAQGGGSLTTSQNYRLTYSSDAVFKTKFSKPQMLNYRVSLSYPSLKSQPLNYQMRHSLPTSFENVKYSTSLRRFVPVVKPTIRPPEAVEKIVAEAVID